MFKKTIFFLFFIFFILIPFGGFFWWKIVSSPVEPNSKEVQIFVIPQGWSADKISSELRKTDLIKSDLAFQLIVFKEKIGSKLQAGDFRLSPSMDLSEIIESLIYGTIDIWVTIPEGLRREEITEKITDSFDEYDTEFDADDFLNKTSDLEGYLFPDTYLFSKEASASSIIRILHGNFEQKFKSLNLKTNLTKEQTVVLASLIEREAKYDKDRFIISGILIKRLREGWPLQIDAAAQYIKASLNHQSLITNRPISWWPQAKPEDLKIDSPYNTYENKGLPPAPICNPGLASLKAVADPKDSEYWFYLSDTSGKMHYAETLEGHERNIEKYLN